jgi:hypothetical protein
MPECPTHNRVDCEECYEDAIFDNRSQWKALRRERGMAERRGDSWVAEIERPHGGKILVFAHDDGGVTVQRYDHRGIEEDRVSFMRDAWDEAVAHVAATRSPTEGGEDA